MSSPNNQKGKPTIGIITALPKEYAAVKALLDEPKEKWFPGKGAGRQYVIGKVSGCIGGKHTVILCLAAMGTNIAAVRANLLLQHFSSIESVLMVGIAGGIPNPAKPDEHVRLGDIVVSNRNGVVQYDFGTETIEELKDKHPPRPPSSELLEAVNLLKAKELEGERPWLQFIERALLPKGTKRPSSKKDRLMGTKAPRRAIRHPHDPKRLKDQPRVFTGPIASANRVLKNPIKRDRLRDKFGVKAVEMEGSGIADAAWSSGQAGYLVIRGICDYCDSSKGDEWQAYAAAVAAAYTRALLEAIPCFEEERSEVQERSNNYKSKLASGRNETSFITPSGDGVVKLDGNRLIYYDLTDLTKNVIEKIEPIGVFLFSIGEDYDLLQKYIIPRLQVELSFKIPSSSGLAYREIWLDYSIKDKLLSQNGEERITNCFKLEKLGYHKLINLFTDGPSDILLVVYNRDFPVANVEDSATDVQKKCMEIQVSLTNKPLCFVMIWANVCSFEKSPLSCDGFIPVSIEHSIIPDPVAFFRKEIRYLEYEEEKDPELKDRIEKYCQELEMIKDLAEAFRRLESIFSELSPKKELL